uniref:Peptidase S1 domain-containing protein n=1 Tax=Steinernema glaseri TaxID=37863 RepID=A0A1I7YUI0_9BILA
MLPIALLLFAMMAPAVALSPFFHDPRIFKIFGGHAARDGQFPYMVYFLKKDANNQDFQCGGTLLSQRFVLTAAHCVQGLRSGQVMVGSTTLQGGRTAQWSSIRRIMSHQGYIGNPKWYNDIAIVEINPVRLNQYVQTVRIVKDDSALFRPRKATAIGFGTYDYTANNAPITSPYLRVAQMILFSHQECRQKNGAYIIESQICAGDQGRGIGAGDSGGPLLVSTNNGMVQVGLSSHAARDYHSEKYHADRYPGVFTRVSSYCGWISKATNGEVNCKSSFKETTV